MRSALTLGVGVPALFCYDRGNIESARLKSHTASQCVQHKGLCGEPLAGHCVHSHSYLHNLGRYNYPSQARHLQRLGIQDFGNPSAWQESSHPSNSGVTHPCRERGLPYQLQQTWQSLLVLVVYLWAYLLRLLKSWHASQVGKGYQLKSAYPYGWQRFWLLPLVAWQDCRSCFLKLNQVVYPYNYSTTNGGRL